MRVLLLLAVVGCDGFDHVAHRGTVCLFGNEELAMRRASFEPQTFEVAKQIGISYAGSTIGCPELAAGCSVISGSREDELVLDAYIAWNDPEPTMCSREIHGIVVQCSAPPLFAGDYTLIWEDQRMRVRVPSTTPEAPCVDRSQY